MKIFNSKDDFSSVESCFFFAESVRFPEVEKEFPSIYKVHDHVEFFFRLERIMKLNQEGVLQRLKDILLLQRVGFLLPLLE